MKFAALTSVVLACTALLTACGGGGGSDTPAATSGVTAPTTPVITTPVTKIEGFYTGTVSTGTQFQLIALENDQIYALIGSPDAQGVFRVSSLLEGSGTSSNGSFSAANAREYGSNGQVTGLAVSGSFNPRATVMGTATSATSMTTFSGTALALTSYNYDTPATLASVTGTWTGATLFGESVTYSVSSTGAVSGASAQGCRFTGTAAPRASGKNVFDATVTFGAAPCAAPGVTGTGIGVAAPLANGRSQLLLALTNAGRTNAVVVFSQK